MLQNFAKCTGRRMGPETNKVCYSVVVAEEGRNATWLATPPKKPGFIAL